MKSRTLFTLLALLSAFVRVDAADERPNILFAITDDQSAIHSGAYGDKCVKTPAFDRLAREGVLFEHAYTACPSCTPSRGAILTGQAIWRLEEGGLLFGALPSKYAVYPLLLEDAGYHVGGTGKTWGPGSLAAGGWKDRHPMGKRYGKRRAKPPHRGETDTDYASNFDDFLADRKTGQPFCFWFGTYEPHRKYEKGSGVRAGKKLADARLPGCLPDRSECRSDVLDYYLEIEHFDRHLARILASLEKAGELDRTLIIATSDHGMPFPRAKTNLYDIGTRVPLAVRWPKHIPPGRKIDDFVSLTDIAPTILEACGIAVPEAMTGRSLRQILSSKKSGRVDGTRNYVVTALERHTWCRPDGVTYPSRAIRTHDYLYIRNYEPDRWPAGDPDFSSPHQGVFGDCDNGPSKKLIIEKKDEPDVAPLFQLAFGQRPAEELYAVATDPEQLRNLAGDPKYAEAKRKLAASLEKHLRATGDPRMRGESPWDGYPYHFKDYAKRAKRK
jgi:uncharacterized sulfatase